MKWYLIVGLYEDGTPAELFMHIQQKAGAPDFIVGGSAWGEALGHMAAIALQHGTGIEEVVDAWKNTRFEPAGLCPGIGMVSSPLDAMARWLEQRFGG
jgi:hypothetical protein